MASTYLLVTLSALFWAANFILAPLVMHDLPPLWTAAARFILAAAAMLAIAYRRGDDVPGLARNSGWKLAALGAVGIFGFNIFFFFALKHTSAVNAALIMATNPLLTTLLAGFIGERIASRQLLAVPLALFGVVIVISNGAGFSIAQVSIGDLLMLGANLAWAGYNVLGRRLLPSGSPAGNTALMMMAGAALLYCAALGSDESFVIPKAQATAALVAMVLFGTVLAYLFWNTGIKRLGAGKTALFLNLIPVFVMLIDVALGILPSAAQAGGGMLVVGAVAMAMLPSRRPALA